MSSETAREFLKEFVKRQVKQEEGNKYKEIFDYYDIPATEQTYENFIMLSLMQGSFDFFAGKSNSTNIRLLLDILYGKETKKTSDDISQISIGER